MAFTLPFFFIVGFDNVGPVTQKFFWYWFFNFLLQATMLFLGELYVSLTPNQATAQSTFSCITYACVFFWWSVTCALLLCVFFVCCCVLCGVVLCGVVVRCLAV